MRLLVFLLLIFFSTYSVGNNFFYEPRYKGWLWFEGKQTLEIKQAQGALDNINSLTREQAKEEMENFAKELEELKYMMLVQPTVENVRLY